MTPQEKTCYDHIDGQLHVHLEKLWGSSMLLFIWGCRVTIFRLALILLLSWDSLKYILESFRSVSAKNQLFIMFHAYTYCIYNVSFSELTTLCIIHRRDDFLGL